MNLQYRSGLIELTNLLRPMEIVALKHGVTYYYWIVKFFDVTKQDEINDICKRNGLVWEVKPQPEKITNGTMTTTGTKLNKIGYKRKPITKGELPREVSRAKIIVHMKKKVKRG